MVKTDLIARNQVQPGNCISSNLEQAVDGGNQITPINFPNHNQLGFEIKSFGTHFRFHALDRYREIQRNEISVKPFDAI